jgi:V-type H+-transporting ATPase subunit D
MSSQNRLPVVPTVTVLTVMKGRLIGATKGHALLKKKADALTMRFRQLLKEIIDAKENLGPAMKGSFFAYTEAQYAAGENVKHTIMDNVDTAVVKVRGELDNVAGVKIPRFESFVLPGETKMDLTGEREGFNPPAPALTACSLSGPTCAPHAGHTLHRSWTRWSAAAELPESVPQRC